MRKIAVILLAIIVAVAADLSPQESYIQKYSKIAVEEMNRSGVPASITLAQGMLESRNGLSPLATKGNNHFGIKCHNDWKGKKMYQDDDKAGECFRVYKNAEQSFSDHSDFLRYQDRYKSLFDLKMTDYESWAKGLKKAGYATDPAYATKLIKVIEDYKLYRFDTGDYASDGDIDVTIDIPVAPSKLESSKVARVEAKEEYRFSLSRTLFERNGVLCIYTVAGDTYESIAQANNLFLGEILRFNDLRKSEELEPGSVVYLQSKRSHTARGLEKYVVGNEDVTVRDIAQRFGVKLSSLKKMNSFTSDYKPHEGDTIILRKK